MKIEFGDPCPVCGNLVVLHCNAPNKCLWWKCSKDACNSFGNQARYYNSILQSVVDP